MEQRLHKKEMIKQRAAKVLLVTAAILAGGLLYAYGANHWGWWLPCIFNQLTGLRCPGCGVARMCLAILRLDFQRAFYWNPVVFCMLPVLAYLYIYAVCRYIRCGNMRLNRWQTALCWIMVILLLIFTVFRNL